MPEIKLGAARPREDLAAEICRRTPILDPSLRVIAEGILGAGSTIDLVAVDGAGRLVLVMVGEAGRDLELFTRGIAQRAWVEPRVRDWLQLAPSLGLSPDAPVKLVLLSPSYHAETLAAAAAFGPEAVALSTYRWVENGSVGGALIEPLDVSRGADPAPGPRVEPVAAGAADDAAPAPETAAKAAPAGSTQFRTGLTEEDLRLTPQEARDFE